MHYSSGEMTDFSWIATGWKNNLTLLSFEVHRCHHRDYYDVRCDLIMRAQYHLTKLHDRMKYCHRCWGFVSPLAEVEESFGGKGEVS